MRKNEITFAIIKVKDINKLVGKALFLDMILSGGINHVQIVVKQVFSNREMKSGPFSQLVIYLKLSIMETQRI